MTLREYMKEYYPDLVNGRFANSVYGCPRNYDFLEGHYSSEICEKCCEIDYGACSQCWDQPYIESTSALIEKNECQDCIAAEDCIADMVRIHGVEAVKEFCICNAMDYLNTILGTDDTAVKKAAWYLNTYIQIAEKPIQTDSTDVATSTELDSDVYCAAYVEKHTPKKPYVRIRSGVSHVYCLICDCHLGSIDVLNCQSSIPKTCYTCGQSLDWKGVVVNDT